MDKNVVKIVVTFEPSMQYDVILDLNSSKPYIATLFQKERQKT